MLVLLRFYFWNNVDKKMAVVTPGTSDAIFECIGYCCVSFNVTPLYPFDLVFEGNVICKVGQY